MSVLLSENLVVALAINRYRNHRLAKHLTDLVQMGKIRDLFSGKVHDEHPGRTQTTPRVLIQLQIRRRGRNPFAIKRVDQKRIKSSAKPREVCRPVGPHHRKPETVAWMRNSSRNAITSDLLSTAVGGTANLHDGLHLVELMDAVFVTPGANSAAALAYALRLCGLRL